MDVSESGLSAGTTHDPRDVMADVSPALVVQQVSVDGGMSCGQFGEHASCGRMQWYVAVVVEFADRDPQPRRAVEDHDRVGGEAAELADAHAGAGALR